MPKMTTPAYPATLDKIPLDLARDMRRAVSEQALAMQAAAIAFASQLHHAAAVMQEAAADLQFITASAASESETPREAIQRRAIARDLTACTWRDLADLLDIAAREARAIQHGGIDPAGLIRRDCPRWWTLSRSCRPPPAPRRTTPAGSCASVDGPAPMPAMPAVPAVLDASPCRWPLALGRWPLPGLNAWQGLSPPSITPFNHLSPQPVTASHNRNPQQQPTKATSHN